MQMQGANTVVGDSARPRSKTFAAQMNRIAFFSFLSYFWISYYNNNEPLDVYRRN